jgi:hypothetical protein
MGMVWVFEVHVGFIRVWVLKITYYFPMRLESKEPIDKLRRLGA